MNTHRTLQIYCRMYLGVKPFNTDTNIIKHDPYFLMSMETLWGKEVVKKALSEEIAEEAVKENIFDPRHTGEII